MGDTRLYEPYGYIEGEAYYSLRNVIDDEITTNRKIDKKQTDESFAKAEYNRSLEAVVFKNANGVAIGQLDMTDIVASELVKEARYDEETQKLIIEFDNGDVVSIDLNNLINQREAGDGLKLEDNKFAIKISDDSEDFLQVTSDGIKNVGIQDAINVERDRALAAEAQEVADRIADVDAEEARAKAEELTLNQLLASEIQNRIDDVDEEEARAKAEEKLINDTIGTGFTTGATETVTQKYIDLTNALNIEVANRTSQDNQIQNNLTQEARARETADNVLENKILAEKTRAQGVEADLWAAISSGGSGSTSGNTYTKAEIDAKVAAINNSISNEATARETTDTVLDGKINALEATVDTKANSTDVTSEIAAATNDMATKTWVNEQGFLTEHQDISNLATKDEVEAESLRAVSAETTLNELKADKDTVYTQSEVDALLLAKENEIYDLTKIVGDMGGAVTYSLPNAAGKSFNTLMSNNGTVKLTDDVETGRFGPGITAKNNVKLNLNTHNLTITGLTTSSTSPAIMSRGTQNITIYGKGTVDAGGGVCVNANGADSVINLTGSTTVYQTNRSGGELIYCYSGTINIVNGTFKNLGANKTYLLNCYDANYQNGTAKIIVTGGKFYDFNPADNTAEGEHTSFLAEGYHVETSVVVEDEVEHTVYTVKKD